MTQKTHAILTLNVVYDGPDATPENVEEILNALVGFAASKGHMASDTLDLVVEQWSHNVDIVEE